MARPKGQNTMDNKTTEENNAKSNLHKPVVMKSLLLAGKLAFTARLVTIANAKNISHRIEQMEEALDEYDNEIMANSNIS